MNNNTVSETIDETTVLIDHSADASMQRLMNLTTSRRILHVIEEVFVCILTILAILAAVLQLLKYIE